jgi:probable phosphoglycerate mutase
MNKIYIVRHGQDQDNANGLLNGHRDTPLTLIGLEQANQIAQKIKDSNLSFDKVYSSPLERAYKTAEIIADTLNLPKPEKIDLLKRQKTPPF